MQVQTTQTQLLAVNAALEAGKRIMQIYESPEADWHVEMKADHSPLTLADKAANDIIVEHLSTTGIPVLSEETRLCDYNERRTWTRLWVVDPLDGTKEFIKRNGEFTVNIALVENGSPVFGVVYVPVKETLYVGQMGEGAWKTTKKPGEAFATWQDFVDASERMPLSSAAHSDEVYVVSRSHIDERTQKLIEGKRTVTTGSSIKICLLAEGSADFYPRFAPTSEWDTAAGHAVLRAAGGELLIADTETPLHYNKENVLNPFFLGIRQRK